MHRFICYCCHTERDTYISRNGLTLLYPMIAVNSQQILNPFPFFLSIIVFSAPIHFFLNFAIYYYFFLLHSCFCSFHITHLHCLPFNTKIHASYPRSATVSTTYLATVIFIFRIKMSGFNINLLKPTGHVMHQQFNIQQLYALSPLCLCVLYLSENKQRLVPLTA